MSLLNDALKRAGEVPQQTAGNGSKETPAPLRPAPEPAKPAVPISWPLILVAGSMFLLAGWFLHTWWEANQAAEVLAALHKSGRETNSTGLFTAPPVDPVTRPMQGSTPAVSRNQPALPPPLPERQVTAPPIATPAPPAPAETTPVPPSAPAQTPTPAPALLMAEAKPITTPAPPPTPPELRLQGIFYRLKDPSVIINGKTMYVGQEWNGMRVLAINRMDATVSVGGQTRILRIAP